MNMDMNVQATNRTWIDSLFSDDPFIQKEGSAKLGGYLKLRAREGSIWAKIRPPIDVDWEDCDQQVDTLKPCIVRDLEPETPSAYSMPFGGVPFDSYVGTGRYRLLFDRVKSRRFTGDVANLRMYTMDIRQVFNDLLLKDILAEIDRKAITTVDALAGTINVGTGTRATEVEAKGYIALGGPVSRDTLALMSEALPSTNRHLDPACSLINNITAKRLMALDHDAIGGPLAQDIFVNGVTEQKIMGTTFYTTIKTDLVATNIIYQFAAPDYLGDHAVLEDITVSVKKEDYMFEMFGYMMLGGSVRNLGAFAKGSFSGSTAGTWTIE